METQLLDQERIGELIYELKEHRYNVNQYATKTATLEKVSELNVRRILYYSVMIQEKIEHYQTILQDIDFYRKAQLNYLEMDKPKYESNDDTVGGATKESLEKVEKMFYFANCTLKHIYAKDKKQKTKNISKDKGDNDEGLVPGIRSKSKFTKQKSINNNKRKKNI